MLVFLAGIGLIGYSFFVAYELFAIPPRVAVAIKIGQPMDFGASASSLIQVFIRVIFLIVMAAFGSTIANRGIKLYTASHSHPTPPVAKE